MANWIIGGLVAAAVFFALRRLFVRRQKGGCCGGSDGCSSCCRCGKKRATINKLCHDANGAFSTRFSTEAVIRPVSVRFVLVPKSAHHPVFRLDSTERNS